MPVTALRQAPIAGLAVPIGTLALVGIAIAASEVGDNALALLHNGFAFLSTLGVVAGFSPAVAGIVAFVLFLAGVVSGLSGFAFSAVAACILWLLPPLQAVPLLMLLSICNQLLSVGKLRQEMVLWGTAEREGALALKRPIWGSRGLSRIARSWAGISSSIDPVMHLHQPR